MENERVNCSQCGTSYNKMFLTGKQGNCDTCPMCGGRLQGENEHPDWITWYYYGFKEDNGKTAYLDDEPIDLNEHGDTFFLIQEFKAPPESECGLDEVKRILRTYVPDAFEESTKTNTVCCPWCGSSEFTLLNRGYSLFTGFWGSGKVKRVCNKCKKEF